MLEHDSKSKGGLQNISVESSGFFACMSFENGSISIFDLRDGNLHKEVDPMERCLPDNIP